MPTFKLEELDDDETFGGDNDMYFRQWRAPSMKPVLDKKLDRDFREAMEKKENLLKDRAERRKIHGEKFEKRLEDLTNKMSSATVKDEKGPFLRAPTEEELKRRRELWNREFEAPSASAVMLQAKPLLIPRKNPIFGKNMANLKSLMLPPASTPQNNELGSRKSTISESTTPKDNSFLNSSQETVFYPQTHSSFNLDHYHGNRPSFAFSGLQGATSTPIGKTGNHVFAGIAEEGDDSVFENSKYVTALESPIQKTLEKEQEAELAREAQRAREAAQKEAERVKLAAQRAQEAELARRAQQEAELAHRAQQESELAHRAQQEAEAAQRAQQEAEAAHQAQQQSELARRAQHEAPPPPKPKPSSRATRVYLYFKNYIGLLPNLLADKSTYEKTAEPTKRALLKRTVIEKVSIFTHRETNSKKRNEIQDFFKRLLNKEQVDGFAVLGEPPKLQLDADDVNYAVYCIVEKYISLAELDVELAASIADVIYRLSVLNRRLEKVFIVLMLNKSVLLRQNPDECMAEFVENSSDPDEKAKIVTREQALLSLFFNVFMKNAFFSATKGRKMVLNEDALWKYTEATVEYWLEVPKSAMLVLQLITSCQQQLSQSADRWSEVLSRLSEDVLDLEEDPFPGDESVISLLKEKLAGFL